MNLKVILIAETPFYSNFQFGVSQDGLSEDYNIQILLPGRKSLSRGLTPTITYHHDHFFFSLLHQEVLPPKKFGGWGLIKQKIFNKNSQNRPFLAVFFGAFLGAPSQGPKNIKNGILMQFYIEITFFLPPSTIFFFLQEITQLAEDMHVRERSRDSRFQPPPYLQSLSQRFSSQHLSVQIQQIEDVETRLWAVGAVLETPHVEILGFGHAQTGRGFVTDHLAVQNHGSNGGFEGGMNMTRKRSVNSQEKDTGYKCMNDELWRCGILKV